MRRRCARPQVERRRLGDKPWGRRGGRRQDAAVTFTARHGGGPQPPRPPRLRRPHSERNPQIKRQKGVFNVPERI